MLATASGDYRGPQLVTFSREGYDKPLVAKIYDPLYYSFADPGFPHIPNNVVVRDEDHFAVEAAAYSPLDHKFGGKLMPKFHGSWIVNIPLKDLERPVGLTLVEHLDGVSLGDLEPKASTNEERLRVVARALDARVRLWFAGVQHLDPACE